MIRLPALRVLVPAIVMAALLGGTAAAQTPEAPSEALPDPESLPPREIQRLFDAYTLMRAQEALALTDEQYPRFLQRLKQLQEARRRHLAARHRVVQDLARLTRGRVRADEARLKAQLRALREIDDRWVVEARQAYDALDATLDTRQQARFRVFEEMVERRKLDLLLRARARAARPGVR